MLHPPPFDVHLSVPQQGVEWRLRLLLSLCLRQPVLTMSISKRCPRPAEANKCERTSEVVMCSSNLKRASPSRSARHPQYAALEHIACPCLASQRKDNQVRQSLPYLAEDKVVEQRQMAGSPKHCSTPQGYPCTMSTRFKTEWRAYKAMTLKTLVFGLRPRFIKNLESIQ